MFGGKRLSTEICLTDQGVQNTKRALWTVIVNLVVMGGVSILYLVMSGLMETLAGGVLPAALPVLAGLVIFALLSFLTHLQQYKATYGLCTVRSRPPACVWRAASQAASRLFRQAGSGRPDGDPDGRCQPHGACLEPRAGLLVRLLYIHRRDRGVPALV